MEQEIAKIIEGEQSISEKLEKILNLEFVDNPSEITTAIVSLYEEAYDDIDITEEELEEDIKQLSYRNSYLQSNPENDAKREDALNTKDRIIKKIEKLMKNKTKGLRENKMKKEELTIKNDSVVYPITEDGTVTSVEEVKPVEIYSTRNTERFDTTPKYDWTQGSDLFQQEKEQSNYGVFQTPPLIGDTPITFPHTQVTEERFEDKIDMIRKKYKALEDAEIRKEELTRRKEEIAQKYTQELERIQRELSNRKEQELSDIDKEIKSIQDSIDSQLANIARGNRAL